MAMLVLLSAWLDSLRADAVFGWRQLKKNKVTSAAAVLSLALAIGACTSAFRLIDALLLRPLPVADPGRLYAISYSGPGAEGESQRWDSTSYPMFLKLRATVAGEAEAIATSYSERTDLTFSSDQDMEKAYRQYVSGWMFSSFGLRPALGRLLSAQDDTTQGTHPYAVLSHDYWARRFGQDPKIIGRSLRMDNHIYQIIGVAEDPFTGTETGTVTDVFVPMTMMNAYTLGSTNSFWFRTFLRLRPGVAVRPLRDKLYALYRAFEQERAKGFTNFPKYLLDGFPQAKLWLDPASSGVSKTQQNYGRSLAILGILVALVLLIACANVANLMTAQAAARAREMALRLSIGAGRWRLVQLVLTESVCLALLAASVGGIFSWWSAPFVVGMINPPDNPARLALPLDWRLFGFGLLLALVVTGLFGLAPALRASSVNPVNALKGGSAPYVRGRLMRALIAVQVAFCFVVLFVGGLFAVTFERLTHQPTGFSAQRLLALDTVVPQGQTPAFWNQVADRLRSVPGVEAVALAGWPLMSGYMHNDLISINGAPPSRVLAYLLYVSPGWLSAMKIPLVDGRDVRSGDSNPGAAIVNRAFAKQYFGGENPIGQSFETAAGKRVRFQIVGLAGDACYRNIREATLPQVYLPFQSVDAKGAFKPVGDATIIVRASGTNPLSLAHVLRQTVSQSGRGFRVTNLRTQTEIDDAQTVRERLLAMLGLFFSAVALLLAGVGLYGVLDYSVLQRRREIGIRMAIGAQPLSIAGRVAAEASVTVLTGAVAGLALGLASVRSLESLFYQVKATDLPMLAIPSVAIIVAAFLATLPALIRAVRVDPAKTLRAE